MSFNNVNFTSLGFGIQNKPQQAEQQQQQSNPFSVPQQNNATFVEDVNKPQEETAKEVQNAFNELEKECSLDNVIQLNDSNVLDVINKKITSIKQELNKEFVNRSEIIDILFLALICNQHVIMLGAPGTAKSQLIEKLNSRITGSTYFQWQFNKTTDPSEIYGPFSIKEMEQDRFVRKTDGMLPEATIAYLDELTRGNSAVLNSLLSIMNERIFYNDGKPQKTPLMSIFASMNDMPDDELQAFTDRFVFKYEVKYTNNKTDTKKLLNAVFANNKKSKTKISLTDIKYLSDKAKDCVVPKTIIDTVANFILEVKAGEIEISDRKIIQAVDVMKANAVLDGRSEINTTDFEALRFVLHDLNNIKSLNHIDSIILKFSNPEQSKLKEYETDFKEMIKSLGALEYDSEVHQFITSNIRDLNNIGVEIANMTSVNKNIDKKTMKKCEDLHNKVTKLVDYLNNKIILNGEQYNHNVVLDILKGNNNTNDDNTLDDNTLDVQF